MSSCSGVDLRAADGLGRPRELRGSSALLVCRSSDSCRQPSPLDSAVEGKVTTSHPDLDQPVRPPLAALATHVPFLARCCRQPACST